MRPDVSAIMAAYNVIANYPEGMFWRSALSALNQMGVTVELCIANDGSTDDTGQLIESLAETVRFVQVASHPKNRGPAIAYNTAAGMATGRYMIQLSVRSWFEPGAFQKMTEALDARPDVGFAYGQTRYHGEIERLHIPEVFDPNLFYDSFNSLHGILYRREAWDRGCRYIPFLEREGRHLDFSDWDFAMQMMHVLNWRGLALRDDLIMNYYYGGAAQLTPLTHKYWTELKAMFDQRWGYLHGDNVERMRAIMDRYILAKGKEVIEVLMGREDRRDRLIQAGYVWINPPRPEAMTAPEWNAEAEPTEGRRHKRGS